MIVRLFALWVLVLCCSCSRAEEAAVSQPDAKGSETVEEAITIPLESIWSNDQKWFGGMDIPKTRQIAKLEGDPRGAGPLVNAICRVLGAGSIEDAADPAFAVEGKDLDALKNAHAVLVGKQPRPTVLPQDSELSIVFFALYSPYHVSLTDVKRRDNTIKIRYELIPHLENAYTDHFSLIPLGKLPPGHYQVTISRDPLRERYARARIKEEYIQGRVSIPFEFDVK